MISKQRKIFEILLILLAFSFQFEAGVIRIDKILTLGLPTVVLLISLFNMKKGKCAVPKILLYFLFFLLWLSIVAVLWDPLWIGNSVRLQRVAYEFVSYLSFFLFFYCAYLVEENNLGDFLFKWIARFTALVASISFFTEAFGLMAIRKYVYFIGNVRFGGFLQNPNDFGLMGLVSFAYWLNTDEEPIYYRIPALLAIVFSFLAGKSKGPIVFIVLFLILHIWNHFSRKTSFFAKKNALYALCIMATVGGTLLFLFLLFQEEIQSIPDLGQNRILNMLVTPGNALNANGSDRILAWNGAIIQILQSPILGVGIGASKAILSYLEYSNPSITPHSMYLELLAQCGVFLGTAIIVLLVYFVKMMSKNQDTKLFILQQAFILLLWYGLFFGVTWYSVSWLLFGILYCKGKNTCSFTDLAVSKKYRSRH